MTVYTTLKSTANLSVNFHMNPANNYKVLWSFGNTVLQTNDVSNTEKGEHIQVTNSISNVTNQKLGKYTVRVINRAITSEHNEATFIITLKLIGKKSSTFFFLYMLLLRIKGATVKCDKREKRFYGKDTIDQTPMKMCWAKHQNFRFSIR